MMLLKVTLVQRAEKVDFYSYTHILRIKWNGFTESRIEISSSKQIHHTTHLKCKIKLEELHKSAGLEFVANIDWL